MQIQCGIRSLDLSCPKVMGILNVTPDSFYDGGSLYSDACLNLDFALSKAESMVAAGSSILDIGGESTRPGAAPVGSQEEQDRVLPLVEAISRQLDVVISVDTSSPDLMKQAASLGAGIVNDVRALSRDGAMAAAASTGLAVCLMHMQGRPVDMQNSPDYRDVVTEVNTYLAARAEECIASGIAKEKILIDPGFGFGKTDKHNLALLESLPALDAIGYPVLVGLSRKSMIGRLLGRELERRLPASLALALVAMQKGAKILRVHDVAETVDVVKVFELTS